MTEQDLDQVAALEQACFSLPWSREAFAQELAAENAVYLVAREDGQVVGYGGMRFVLDEFYVDNIAVAAQRRRQGVGRALVAGPLSPWRYAPPTRGPRPCMRNRALLWRGGAGDFTPIPKRTPC